MNILALDTSTELLSVELRTEKCRVYETVDFGLRHSETLMDIIRETLQRGETRPEELDLFACTGGPGSFTGLRIGMSTIKGLSAGSGKPFVAVPTLDCFAFGFEFFPGTVVPVIDARKSRLYTALYENGVKLTADLDIRLEDLFTLLQGKHAVLFTGPFAGALLPQCEGKAGYSVYSLSSRGNPGAVAALAERIYLADGGSPSDSSPLYIRKSEPELQ